MECNIVLTAKLSSLLVECLLFTRQGNILLVYSRRVFAVNKYHPLLEETTPVTDESGLDLYS
jgi:hypothetical protein